MSHHHDHVAHHQTMDKVSLIEFILRRRYLTCEREYGIMFDRLERADADDLTDVAFFETGHIIKVTS